MIYETRINLKNKTKDELILFVEEGLQTISKYQAELEKKDKIIDLMAERLVEAHEWFYSEFDNYTKEDFIEYFKRKVEDK